METLQIRIEESAPPTRLDVYLSKRLNLLSRSQLKERVMEIRLNGRKVKASHRVTPGGDLEVFLRPLEPPQFSAEELPLRILYEDSHVIVVDKPEGMVVHPGAGVNQGTLVQGLLYHVRTLKESFPEESIRPGIVHRLDKETSGVLIAAKDPMTLEYLSAQFRNKGVEKIYVAIVKGCPSTREGLIQGILVRDPRNRKRFRMIAGGKKGKSMETWFRVLRRFGPYSWILLKPKTGRTHQLRVQMQALGCPILGDPVYSRTGNLHREGIPLRLYLHAFALRILLPEETTHRTFYSPIPEAFKKTLRLLAESRGT
ncbi:MAG: RluA family pseudouridine synthase [Spirochaetes bacterium]|nr:RluA family pseudouridine synthase [Spirochaetota bacterium]